MTMVWPGSSERAGLPSFPWAPDVIEDMEEEEREAYLKHLRETRQTFIDSFKKKPT